MSFKDDFTAELAKKFSDGVNDNKECEYLGRCTELIKLKSMGGFYEVELFDQSEDNSLIQLRLILIGSIKNHGGLFRKLKSLGYSLIVNNYNNPVISWR